MFVLFSSSISLPQIYREAFSAVLESMESIGFSSSEVDQIITLLAAILHIGDIVSDTLTDR